MLERQNCLFSNIPRVQRTVERRGHLIEATASETFLPLDRAPLEEAETWSYVMHELCKRGVICHVSSVTHCLLGAIRFRVKIAFGAEAEA